MSRCHWHTYYPFQYACHRLAVLVLLAASLLPPGMAAAESGAGARWLALESLVQHLQGLAPARQAEAVNRFFNAYPQHSDLDTWGVRDYWASPSELVQQGAGDCEDHAIAKFYLLLRLGVPESRLQLMVSKIYNPGSRSIEGHMVLVFRGDDNRAWILDNMDPSMRALSDRSDIVPQLSFNRAGEWRASRDPFNTAPVDEAVNPRQHLLARLDSIPSPVRRQEASVSSGDPVLASAGGSPRGMISRSGR